MSQIFEYFKSLDWANNWAIYIITSALILWFGILTIKLVFNKLTYVIKKLLIISILAVIASILSYMFFLMGFIQFDVLSLIGFGEISEGIQQFLNNLHEWFTNTFSLGFINFRFLV